MTDEDNKDKLREKIRLSEKRLDEQYAVINTLDRKAALLITFCVAVIGYLLAHDTELVCKPAADGHYHCWAVIFSTAINILFIITKVISPAILAGGVLYGWRAILLTDFWSGAGLWNDNESDNNLTEFLERLLNKHRDSVRSNFTAIEEKKIQNIKTAVNCVRWGIALSLISVVLWEIIAFFTPGC